MGAFAAGRAPYLLRRAPSWAKRELFHARRAPSLDGGSSYKGAIMSEKGAFTCLKGVFAVGKAPI